MKLNGFLIFEKLAHLPEISLKNQTRKFNPFFGGDFLKYLPPQIVGIFITYTLNLTAIL